jgi:hypothetical protein
MPDGLKSKKTAIWPGKIYPMPPVLLLLAMRHDEMLGSQGLSRTPEPELNLATEPVVFSAGIHRMSKPEEP